MARKYNALLINPWIYDVAAHDFWAKPLGLLYLAALLEKAGVHVELLDCLDRFDPELQQFNGLKIPNGKKNGTGKYVREKITPPTCLLNFDRQYSRYGFPLGLVRQKLNRYKKPDIILVTSAMTYWYPAVADMIKICREKYPNVPIILGGIYASLCTAHANKNIGADLVFCGQVEQQLFDVIRTFIPDFPGQNLGDQLDDYPFPAYHLYPYMKYLPILTSRGCPFHCSFCASNLLVPKFRHRSVGNVVEEILFSISKFNLRHFAFYDDALFVDRHHHIEPILQTIISKHVRIHFHTPNGLHPKYIDQDLAKMLVQSGFETIRLSFETASSEYKEAIDSKVCGDDLANSIDFLEQAGFPRKKIEVYLLTGLPGQNLELTVEDMLFAHALGVKIRLAQFSPIPGTKDWDKAIKYGMDNKIDLVCTNSSVFAREWGAEYYHMQQKFHHFSRVLNYAIDLDLPLSGENFFLSHGIKLF